MSASEIETWIKESLAANFPDPPSGSENREAPTSVMKLSAYTSVTCCLLTDETGIDHCEHPPRLVKPLPWTWRARQRWWDVRVAVARWIAGSEWPRDED